METVTSADPVPAVMVTWPAARAVRIGGSLVERLTMVGSLDAHVSPLTEARPDSAPLKTVQLVTVPASSYLLVSLSPGFVATNLPQLRI